MLNVFYHKSLVVTYNAITFLKLICEKVLVSFLLILSFLKEKEIYYVITFFLVSYSFTFLESTIK